MAAVASWEDKIKQDIRIIYKGDMVYENLTQKIICAAIEVHKHLGPGLMEKCYECAMVYELQQLGLDVKTQVPVHLMYKGMDLMGGTSEKDFLRLDMLVDDAVIVELKSVEAVKDVHHKQLLTYMKLTDKKVGLLINFNESRLVDGIFRKVM